MNRSLASAAAATAALRAAPRLPLASCSAASRPASMTRDSSRSSSAVSRGTLPMSFRYRPMESFMMVVVQPFVVGSGFRIRYCAGWHTRRSVARSSGVFGALGSSADACLRDRMWGTFDSTRRVKRVNLWYAPSSGSVTRRLRRRAVARIADRRRAGRPSRRDAAAGAAPRIGLFGGTFDPPHVGHLVTAVNVRHALELDVVVLMVANVPWQKEGSRPITPAARPLGDGRGGRRRRARPRGRPARDRPRRAELHGRHAGRARRREPGRRAVHHRRRRRRGRPHHLGAPRRGRRPLDAGRRRPARRAGRAARRLRLDPRRGAPPRGVEHRPAGPLRRRPPARLPRHRAGAAGHRRARPVPGRDA